MLEFLLLLVTVAFLLVPTLLAGRMVVMSFSSRYRNRWSEAAISGISAIVVFAVATFESESPQRVPFIVSCVLLSIVVSLLLYGKSCRIVDRVMLLVAGL